MKINIKIKIIIAVLIILLTIFAGIIANKSIMEYGKQQLSSTVSDITLPQDIPLPKAFTQKTSGVNETMGYNKKDGKVYFYSRIIQDADYDTFEVMAEGYLAKDKNNIYNGDTKLKPYDDEKINTKEAKWIENKGLVIGKKLFLLGDFDLFLVKDVDVESFTTTENICAGIEKSRAYYNFDKDHVFAFNSLLNNIDKKSFVFLGNSSIDMATYGYAKDKNNVYVKCGDIVPDADVNTFTLLDDAYSKDKTFVWFGAYSKEDNMEGGMGFIIKGADPDTFVTLGNYSYKAKDKNNTYLYGIKQ